MNQNKERMLEGMNMFSKRIEKEKQLYVKLLDLVEKDTTANKVYRITNAELFEEVISTFGAALTNKKSKYDLKTIYEIGIHKETGALIISNKGASLYALAPKTNKPYLIKHIGLCVYFPGLGIEFVNVGLVGDVYNEQIVLRSESACTPSFIYGSQRCNCNHQWESIRELAAHYNEITPPIAKNGEEFENWVQGQITYENGKHIFKNKGKKSFILMHLDTQNGMGSGFTEGEFAFDLFTRASIRHRGEYTAEQTHNTSMLGGFEAIGLESDPRQKHNNAGYKLTFVILDYLEVGKDIAFLTNNPLKMEQLENNGYKLTRIKTVGAVNLAGSQEAEQRGSEFHHLDINGDCISFEEELNRLKSELDNL